MRSVDDYVRKGRRKEGREKGRRKEERRGQKRKERERAKKQPRELCVACIVGGKHTLLLPCRVRVRVRVRNNLESSCVWRVLLGEKAYITTTM